TSASQGSSLLESLDTLHPTDLSQRIRSLDRNALEDLAGDLFLNLKLLDERLAQARKARQTSRTTATSARGQGTASR
ncbi:unnamed protein product, partial [Polarella glacialis]